MKSVVDMSEEEIIASIFELMQHYKTATDPCDLENIMCTINGRLYWCLFERWYKGFKEGLQSEGSVTVADEEHF